MLPTPAGHHHADRLLLRHALITLQRLQGDSELVVMASAGYSLRQLAVPVLGCAAIVMALTYACVLLPGAGGPAHLARQGPGHPRRHGRRPAQRGRVQHVSPQGLTVFIRQLSNSGEIRGMLVHDSRDRAHPVTYIAEKGILAQTPGRHAPDHAWTAPSRPAARRRAAPGAAFRQLHHQSGPVRRPCRAIPCARSRSAI